MSDHKFQDRRKHVRIYRNFILSYRIKGKEDIKHDITQVNNISQGGMSFAATGPLSVGSSIFIELHTPFLNDKVDLQGAILDSREKISNLIYEIRIEFKDLSELAKEVLVKIEKYSVQQEHI